MWLPEDASVYTKVSWMVIVGHEIVKHFYTLAHEIERFIVEYSIIRKKISRSSTASRSSSFLAKGS